MKVYLHQNLHHRVKDITGKDLKNMTVYIGDKFIADNNSNVEIGEGIYNVTIKIEYEDGSIDILEDEKIWISTKDVKVTINYKKFSGVIAARMTSPLFWVGVFTSLFGIGLLILIFAFYFSDKSKYYQKHGSSIFTLRNR